MGQRYFVSVDAVALGAATAKSIFELNSNGATVAIQEWWVEFDGTNASAVPGKVEVGRFSAAITTGTTISPSKYSLDLGTPQSSCKHTSTAEGAGTASDVFNHRVPPTGGLYVQYPLGQELRIAVLSFFRIRCTFAAAVNVSFGVSWEE